MRFALYDLILGDSRIASNSILILNLAPSWFPTVAERSPVDDGFPLVEEILRHLRGRATWRHVGDLGCRAREERKRGRGPEGG